MVQLLQQLAQQGMTGRHEPFAGAPEQPVAEEPQADPRYAAADDALVAGDLDTAITEYQKLVDANQADTEAALGLSRAKLMKRTSEVDLASARQAAADAPDDVDAQIMVADLDLLGGHVEDAFIRAVPDAWEWVVPSPVVPLGAHAVLGPVSQDWVVSTVRSSEVAADPTVRQAYLGVDR